MHENHPGVQVNIIVSMYFPLWFFIWLLIVQDRSHIGLHWHVSSRRCNKLFFCCRTWHVILSWKLSRNVNVNLFLHRHVPHFYLWQAYCCSSVSLHTPCSIAILISLYIPCSSSVSLHIPCSLSHDNVFFLLSIWFADVVKTWNIKIVHQLCCDMKFLFRMLIAIWKGVNWRSGIDWLLYDFTR